MTGKPYPCELTLVLLAHPDDEFALFPWILEAIRQGRRVVVAWLTDGGWGGQSLEPRRKESLQVLTRLGLPVEDMHFLGEDHGIKDGSLMHQAEDAVQRVADLLGKIGEPSEVWIPAWEGGHQDHDAAHLVGLDIATSWGAEAYQFPLYNGSGLRGPWFRVMSPLPTNGSQIVMSVSGKERFRCALRCLTYRSQWKSFMGILPFYMLALLRRNPFVFQRSSIERIEAKPHQGFLLYERRGGPSWGEFLSATRNLRKKLVNRTQRSSESIQKECQLDASNSISSESP